MRRKQTARERKERTEGRREGGRERQRERREEEVLSLSVYNLQ